ncbi:MAG: ATP-binding protein [Planctomycetes bacterium]|nr:ATP-binding protein [Planctomycetota bacterium]
MCNSFLECGRAYDEFALRPLLEEEIRSAIASAAGSGLRVALKCSSDFVAYADEAALRRFTQNALLNALSVSPLTAGPRVEVAPVANGRFRLSVTDAGPGMSARGVERAYKSGASGIGSTGFGTDSMSQAASDLGSKLRVSTGQGSGTGVSIVLQSARDGKPVAVVLDRDPLRRSAALQRLREEGWWCTAPASVEAAIGAMERLGATQVLVARGSSGSSTAELIEASGDLDIPCREYSSLAEL